MAAPGNESPDSAPAAPTITDAPPPRAVSIRIPPLALLLPIGLIAVCALAAYRSALPEAPRNGELAAALEGSRTALDEREPEAARANGAAGDEVAEDEVALAARDVLDDTTLAEPPEVVAQKIAQLEKSRAHAELLDAARARVKVTLYMNERCTRCVEAKSHLIARGIFPIERDIDKDPRARSRHRALTRKRGLPTLEIDGKVLVGFQPERLDKAIERAATTRLKRKR